RIGAESQRRIRTMSNASRVWFYGAAATFLAVNGFLLSLEARPQSPSTPAASPAPAASHQTFVKRYCVACHHDRTKRSDLTLEPALAHDVGDTPQVWEKLVPKIRARQMPPIGLTRPDET